jgi:hypothetical protein
MMKPLYGLIVIILVGVAFLAGNSMPSVWESGEKNSLITTVSARFPAIDFQSCSALPINELSTCIDGQFAGYAATHGDASVCVEIQNQAVRATCEGRAEAVRNLRANPSGFCEGISDDPLCVDLSAVLFARLENKRENCLTILSEELRSFCVNTIGQGAVVSAPEQILGENGLPIKQYGLICSLDDEDCLSAKALFNAAVLGQSPASCAALGLYSGHCLDEVALYQSHVNRDPSFCETRMATEECGLQLTVAQALEGRPDLCSTLPESQIQACLIEVDLSGGGTRFGYASK